MRDADLPLYFRLFNEIGILAQLSRAAFEARLPDGMLVPHFSVLNHLMRVEDGRTPLDLARAFQVPKTTMTHTLSGLEAAGFVEMRPNPEDGRSKQVWITEPGRRFREQSIEALMPDLDALAAEFSEDHIAQLVPKLQAIREWMDDRRG